MASITKRSNGRRVQARRAGSSPVYGQFESEREAGALARTRRRDLKTNEVMMITGHDDSKMFLRYVHVRAAKVAAHFRGPGPAG